MTTPGARWAAAGALLCASAVALSAVASHAVQGVDAQRLAIVAAMLALHGLGWIALRGLGGRLAQGMRAAQALGLLLFAGSLVAAVLWDASTRLAPLGGVTLIVAWMGCAVALWRRG